MLKAHGVEYKKYQHAPVRTSEEADALRPEYTLAQGTKALIVCAKRTGKKWFAMVVVPGDKKFDAKKVKEVLGASDLRFATQEEVRDLTDGVEPGGVPPFGNLWDLPVLADEGIFQNETMIFSAGDRSVSIAMATREYQSVIEPNVISIT